ncbi:hypothetical protein SELR_13350 [Selenomonas ruminantium subsp. lactilytica TAM6421]|uniref:Uncharacterized protein n=1 Tax=Selenomonas ruminantium subsp. lactilytica (strain NBRC 103574 / TAM6421) TaxID=927704 RepID=I0GQK6_SELRL|nr:hypothetical protein [Selenomonas ruminantium]BAL83043.1 hypothetical protein SELR_13350 [Selenomonas ruminantium subsp. lactilytica TAM6421]
MLELEKREIILQGIEAVIKDMENRYSFIELEGGSLNLIYVRYKKAYQIIKEHKEDDSVIYINGGIRAYLDSYSDWDNPLLGKMGDVEKLYDKYVMKHPKTK